MASTGGHSRLCFGVVLALMLAMLLGPQREPPVCAAGGVGMGASAQASRQHPLPAHPRELVAEAENSRDELEELADTPAGTGLLRAGFIAPTTRPVGSEPTWWVGRPRLGGGAGGLGRGPPARA